LRELLGATFEGEGQAGSVPDGIARAIGGCLARLAELAQIGESALCPRDRRMVCVLSLSPAEASTGDGATDGAWSLTVTPVDVSETLAMAYSGLPVLFTSATLDTGEGGDMRYSLDRIGLGFVPRHRRHVLPSVLPYETQAAFAVARAMVYAP